MGSIIEISTGVGCSPNCSFCPQKTHVTNYAARSSEFKMSMETFETCLNNIPKHIEIMFAGMAEPWLNSLCTDMLLAAHAAGHRVSVYTTCVGMKEADVERFKHLPFDLFCIHLPDDAGKMHVNVSEEYLKALQACLKIPRATLMCVGQVHPAVQKAINRKVGDGTKSLISRAGNVPGMKAVYKSGKLKHLACMDHSVLLPNGEVALCCCDYSLQHILGNLTQAPHRELFKGDEWQRLMTGLQDESIDIICRKCELSECEK